MLLLNFLCVTIGGSNQDVPYLENVTLVPRILWGAQPPTSITRLPLPVPMVVIHHSFIPGVCFSFEECSASMRSMQRTHQVDNGWADIGYNFAVGGNGYVYEGRGWTRVGAHARGYNDRSIGIVLVGDWVGKRPSAEQLQATEELIAIGVREGFIHPQYQLVGHRQLLPTECPGDGLYGEIQTWDQFDVNM